MLDEEDVGRPCCSILHGGVVVIPKIFQVTVLFEIFRATGSRLQISDVSEI